MMCHQFLNVVFNKRTRAIIVDIDRRRSDFSSTLSQMTIDRGFTVLMDKSTMEEERKKNVLQFKKK